MDFSEALRELRGGGKIKRGIWDGGAYLMYMRGHPNGIVANEALTRATGMKAGRMAYIRPYLLKRMSEANEFVLWTPDTEE
ncbi:MAG: hypothetical protein U9N61_11070, partial [Euryarchaeota archaeon]|nr:hypothetical protein [Euryarchaeota archaeon]